jgi:hypothetical protein
VSNAGAVCISVSLVRTVVSGVMVTAFERGGRARASALGIVGDPEQPATTNAATRARAILRMGEFLTSK